jgi:glutathione S-transferase
MASTRLVLFGSRLSPFVEKVARALALKKMDFELAEPKGPGDFSRWNPQTGKMPVLEIDGGRIYDSTFIARRLDELFPEPPLLASDPATAAAQELLEDWCDESLYWYGMALRWTPKNASATAEQILGSLPPVPRMIARRILPRRIIAMTRAQGFGRLPEDVVLVELGRQLDNLVSILGEGPFFHSDRISIADLAVHGQFHMLSSGPTPEADALLRERPALIAHRERVEAETGSA